MVKEMETEQNGKIIKQYCPKNPEFPGREGRGKRFIMSGNMRKQTKDHQIWQ